MYNSVYKELVGKDKNGKELYCGDICDLVIGNKHVEGMIVYDPDAYAFACIIPSKKEPYILMHNIGKHCISYKTTMMRDERAFRYRNDDGTFSEITYCEDEIMSLWRKSYLLCDAKIISDVKNALDTFPIDAYGLGGVEITYEDVVSVIGLMGKGKSIEDAIRETLSTISSILEEEC